MSELKCEGTIKLINPINQVSDKFTKQEFVIETEDQYPQTIKFECQQDRCNLLVGKSVGDKVSVFFNLRGREWMNKDNKIIYFTTLAVWRIEKVATAEPTAFVGSGNVPEPKEADTELPF